MSREITLINLAVGATIAQAASLSCPIVAIGHRAPEWKFSVHTNFTSAGAATLKVEVLISNDGVNFVEIDADVVTGLAKDTQVITAVAPTFCGYFYLKITEENTAIATAVNATLAMR